MTSPLKLFRQLWQERCPVFFVEAVNYPADTDTFPDVWGAVIYQSAARADVSLGSSPWVEETGFFGIGLFARSGTGPDVLDDAVDQVRHAFAGVGIENLLIESVDGPHDVDPQSDGEWWTLALSANFKFQTRRVTAGTPYLGLFVGHYNAMVDGVPWTSSQQGDFTEVSWAIPGELIRTKGPDPEFVDGYVRKRAWGLPGRYYLWPGNSQSNGVGATSNLDGDVSPFARPPVMLEAPFTSTLFCWNGGFEPNQGGVTSASVTTPTLARQFARLVAGKAFINEGRDPGREVYRSTWAAHFGEAMAFCTPPGSINHPMGVGHGSSTFQQLVGQMGAVDTATWADGVAAFETPGFHPVQPGNTFEIIGCSNPLFDAVYIALEGTDQATKILKGALAVDPGGPGTGGQYDFYAVPWVDLINEITFAATVIAPSLGLIPELPAFMYHGNEANASVGSVAAWDTLFFSLLRRRVNKLRDLVNPALPDPWIIWPAPAWPANDWHMTDPSRWNTGSYFAQGLLEKSRDPANRLLTFAQHANKAGGAPPNDGDNAGACIHNGEQGHSDNGYRGRDVFIDAEEGLPTAIPSMLYAWRFANSPQITVTLSQETETVTDQYIVDPGADGYQAYAGALTGMWGHDVAIVGKTLDGSTATLQLGLVPQADSNWVGFAWSNARVYVQPNNNPILNIAFTAPGQATITTGIVNAIPSGVDLIVANATTLGFNGRYTVIDGDGLDVTTTTTLADPGVPYDGGGNIALNGQYGFGRVDGLRGRDAAKEPAGVGAVWRHNQTGKWLRKYQGIQLLGVDVFADTGQLTAALQQCGLWASALLVLDPSDAACIANAAAAVLANPGPSGALDNFFRGITPGGGANAPQLVGVPGSFSASTHLVFDGTVACWLQPVGAPDIWRDAHKAGGGLTFFFAGRTGTVAGANARYIATTGQMEGGGAMAGSCARLAANGLPGVLIKNDTNQTVFGQSQATPIPLNTDYVFAGSIADGNVGSWLYDNINGRQNFNCQYNGAVPSAGNAQFPLMIGNNGAAGGNHVFNAGATLGGFVPMNAFVTFAKALPFIRSLERKHLGAAAMRAPSMALPLPETEPADFYMEGEHAYT